MRRLAFAGVIVAALTGSASAQTTAPAAPPAAAPAPTTPTAAPAPTATPAAAPAPTATPAAAPAGNVEAGETSFKKCLPCHSVGKSAKNKVGPELNGLDGRKSGTAEGYNYSEANKSSGITWNAETFREYIKNPRAKIPNTKMVFAGIKVSEEAEKAKTDEITNLWAYLSQFNADGKTPKDIEEEKKAGEKK